MNEQEKLVMDKIHDANFEMLCEIDRICAENNISYFLHGGTLLGAIRHKDFIPWDDDVDIIIKRKELERFLAAFKKVGSEHFSLIAYEDHPQFYDFMPKFASNRLTLASAYGSSDFYDERYNHPTVDFLILDYESKHHGFQLLLLKLLYSLAMGHRPSVDHGKYHGVTKVASYILPTIGKLIPFRRVARWYTSVQQWAKEGDKMFISNEQQNPKYWGVQFDPAMYEPGNTGTIRGKEFPIPLDAERYLAQTYGDYMKFPPVEEQKPQHVLIITEDK